MRTFLRGLSRLFRESDTAPLEFVIGLIALSIGAQFIAGLFGLTSSPVLLNVFPFPFEFLLSFILILGAIIKVVGAVLNIVPLRMYSALAHSTVWFTMFVGNLSMLSVWAMVFLLILGLQSAWIYIRLALMRKEQQNK